MEKTTLIRVINSSCFCFLFQHQEVKLRSYLHPIRCISHDTRDRCHILKHINKLLESRFFKIASSNTRNCLTKCYIFLTLSPLITFTFLALQRSDHLSKILLWYIACVNCMNFLDSLLQLLNPWPHKYTAT